ncbi:diguanylate cyclase [Mesorhizobium sp. ANAO-SY3R2]|uniref:GGDEF domain-containing protein n=1 Tax=Mesorhizobium sp. ANAO-SY3R2 TaxID=3166644 RepID=UPI00366D2537
MSGAGFILAINLFVAGLLASAFMMIAVYDVRRISARWLALAYALGVAYLAIEAVIPLMSNARMAVVLGFATFLGATIVLNVGLAHKYDSMPPWKPMLAFLALATLVVYFVQDLPRHSLGRMMAYQLPFGAMQFAGALLVWSARKRLDRLDYGLMAILSVSGAHFIAKPFMAHALGGWGTDPQAYLGSTYALFSQSLGTVLSISLALLILVVLVRDVLGEATARSETDALSGLLNRGGFERHAAAALRDAVRQGLPVTLVISDLDHFKAINDSYGHASGDRVIEAFSHFIHESKAGHHIAGRIGGEEFAIILPGTHLAAARLFAEGARSAFSALPIQGLPASCRFTASFGVAELVAGEGIDQLLRRADAALYEAKKDGRDCVRLAAGNMAQLPADSNIVSFGGKPPSA